MTTISDERLAELVGFHKTVPFRSEHDDELVAALTELRSLRAQGGVRVRAYVKRNAPGHDGDGGEVVVPFETDADMRRILASLEASPAPVSEEMVAQTIWNEHLFHADALVYGDKMIVPDMAMAERLASIIVAALAARGGQ